MLAKFTVTYALLTQEMVDDLNSQTQDYRFVLTEQMGLVIPPDVGIIVCEFLKNLGYNAAYDLVKASLLSLISKICKVRRNEKTKISVFYEGKSAEIVFSFDLSEEQKNEIINAVVKRILMK